MSKQHMKIFIMTIIVSVFFALIGTTYAYFQIRIIENENKESVNVKATYLAVKYIDGTASFSGVSNGYVFPGETFTKTFTVENTGTDTAYFNIILKDVINTFKRTEDWTYVLKIDDAIIAGPTEFPASNTIIYTENNLAVNSSKTYKLEITYAKIDDPTLQEEDRVSELAASIDIEGTKKEEI